MGVPSVFIRTSGCNLRCTWCDTPYTSWAPEGEDYKLDQIVAEVKRFGAAHAVLTGGEPMIAPEIILLASRLGELGLHVTIETAGTVYQRLHCDLMSISPKLKNSVPVDREGGRWAAQHERLRYQPEVLRRLMAEYAYQFKFVVSSPSDLDEIDAMITELSLQPGKVILMPEGIDSQTLQERGRWIVEICKERGFRFSPRLHVDLWGARRGV